MPITYPVRAVLRASEAHDTAVWCIVDARGRYAEQAPSEAIFATSESQATNIATAINAAYQQGLADAREAMRLALGIEE